MLNVVTKCLASAANARLQSLTPAPPVRMVAHHDMLVACQFWMSVKCNLCVLNLHSVVEKLLLLRSAVTGYTGWHII